MELAYISAHACDLSFCFHCLTSKCRLVTASRLLGFHGGYQHTFHLNRWPTKDTECQKAGKTDQYDRYCREKADSKFHIIGMTAKASTVRGYWDFEKTDVGKLTERYGFQLAGVKGVPSGKSLQYLSINAGRYHWEKSDVSVAEFIMYKGALDDKQVPLILISRTQPICHFLGIEIVCNTKIIARR